MQTLVNSLRLIAFSALLAGGLALFTGCGGNGATFQATGNQTLGRELQDLQASYEKGILSNKEFESAKKQLIKKYTR